MISDNFEPGLQVAYTDTLPWMKMPM